VDILSGLTDPVKLPEIITAKAADKHDVHELTESKKKQRELMTLIITKIEDPNFSLAEVNRTIALLMMLIIEEATEMRSEPTQNHNVALQKSYDQQIKNLQNLEKSLTNTDVWRRRDILNFDGPKFQYVFNRIVDMMKKAATDAWGKNSETQVQSFMKHFRDEVAANEDDMRKQTEKQIAGDKENN
jgi:hypothetical protein